MALSSPPDLEILYIDEHQVSEASVKTSQAFPCDHREELIEIENIQGGTNCASEEPTLISILPGQASLYSSTFDH